MDGPSRNSLDRRYVPRIRQDLPARIEFFSPRQGKLCARDGRLTAISSRGFTMHLLPLPLEEIPAIVDIEFPLGDIGKFRATCKVRQRRLISDLEEAIGLHVIEANEGYRVMLDQFMSTQSISRTKLFDRRTSLTIHSEPFEIRKASGLVIKGMIDRSVASTQSRMSAIIVPSFGETKIDAIPLSYLLAANGIHCYRYDATRHVGESTGSILESTLGEIEEDVRCVIRHAIDSGEKNIALIAAGLSARVCIRVLSEQPQLFQATFVGPVVNLLATLENVYDENVFKMQDLDRVEITDLFGFPVSITSFVSDAKKRGYEGLAATQQELSKLSLSVQWIAFRNDERVSFQESTTAFEAIGSQEKFFFDCSVGMPGSGFSNLPVEVVSAIATKLLLTGRGQIEAHVNLVRPDSREIASQKALERERLRATTASNPDLSGVEFWGKYLERFHFISRVPEYRSFYEKTFESLGDLRPGDRILDAGCGNGSLGLWLLMQEKFRDSKEFDQDLLYVGIDLVPQAVTQAVEGHKGLISQLRQNGLRPRLSFTYNVGNLSASLPYPDNYFEHIACNLVLSYLSDPSLPIAEFHRVLKSKGKLVITSIKPSPDFSEIYRTTLKYCQTPEERKGCRRLLDNVAGIVEKEKHGVFRFFGREELLAMADPAPWSKKEIQSSFGDQANILTLEKA